MLVSLRFSGIHLESLDGALGPHRTRATKLTLGQNTILIGRAANLVEVDLALSICRLRLLLHLFLLTHDVSSGERCLDEQLLVTVLCLLCH